MKSLFYFLLFLILTKSLYADSAVVFMYHRFGENKYPSTNIRIEQFKSHLEYLEKNKFNVLPLSKIITLITNKKNLPKKTVAITIDDAYLSIYEKAYPLLREKKFPFTVFVNTSVISKKENSFMNWSHMREMAQEGAEFANHSLTHDFLLPRKDEAEKEWQKRLKKEIVDAQKKLQEHLGEDTNANPKLLSYPYGEYTLDSAKYVKSLGYIGITQTSGVLNSKTDLKTVPRFAMSESLGDIDNFALKANTLPLPVASASTVEPLLKGENPPTLFLKLEYPLENMNCFIANGEKIDIEWISDTQAKIKANTPLKAPRNRYTCTAKDKTGRWYWHSHLWIINND